MSKLIEKLREPTTYAGIPLLLNAIGVAIKPEMWQEITTICMGIAGIALIWYKESKK